MAAIDKLYGTQEQYDEFYSWCSENKEEALRYFYSWNTKDELKHVICLLPEEIDMWLLDNCPLGWVVSQIKEQYDLL